MTWRKSSHSGSGGDCVEIRGDLRALRDSKSPDTVVRVSRAATRNLVTMLKSHDVA